MSKHLGTFLPLAGLVFGLFAPAADAEPAAGPISWDTGGSLTHLRQALPENGAPVAEHAVVWASPEPAAAIGGVDFTPFLGRYELASGKAACARELSVAVSEGGLVVASPEGLRSLESVPADYKGRITIGWPAGKVFDRINGGQRQEGGVWPTGLGRSDISEETTARKKGDGVELVQRYAYKDTYAGLKTKTVLKFGPGAIDLKYRDSDTGAPLEMGFWQSLGLKGKKLDLDLDCRYSKAGSQP